MDRNEEGKSLDAYPQNYNLIPPDGGRKPKPSELLDTELGMTLMLKSFMEHFQKSWTEECTVWCRNDLCKSSSCVGKKREMVVLASQDSVHDSLTLGKSMFKVVTFSCI
ncbi:hypothetical protein WISP_146852 [Willisornis vidua]|uniref:Uncharacterized protein n=1 Tax=Willisornis vidua TaxID=1566151 RepID=A0ABQ9CQQ5_9PASS|nr:hypothetical protein WISP_146852 [Willisornis vidua]